MSRSYKHTSYCGCKKSKFHKNQANRKVRQTPIDKDIFQSKGKSYQKLYKKWNICDYYEHFVSYFDYLNSKWNPREDSSKERNNYKKFYYRK